MSAAGAPGSAFAGWEPQTVVELDEVRAGPALALHGLLDAPGEAPGDGDPLPLLWHWLAFVPRVPQSELGGDGHARVGSFLPPVALPRRMFAGARMKVRRPLTIGAPLTRSGIVTSVTNKQGRSGELCFVTVRYEITDDRGGDLVEEQDLVYRSAVQAPTAPGPPVASHGQPRAEGEPGGGPGDPSAGGRESAPVDPLWPWALDVGISPTLLFRFSALTYNAHRIHYDRDYARDVEGYPGLVVHGPLQAVLLAELCRREAPDRELERFSFLARSPAFDGGTMGFRGRPGDDGNVSLEARDEQGAVTMAAEATLADRSGG